MPPTSRILSIASILTLIATFLTSIYYYTQLPSPFSPAADIVENSYPMRLMLAYNGVFSIILWRILSRTDTNMNKIKVSLIHLITGMILIFLAIVIAPAVSHLI